MDDDRRERYRREDLEDNVVWGLIGAAAVLVLVWAISFNIRTNQQLAATDLRADPPVAARTAPER